MIYIIFILSLLVVILGFTTFNLLRKTERYEDELNKRQDAIISYQEYINGLGSTVEFMTKRIDEIDSRGTFKSDDEVGFFFERLKMLNDMLKPYNIKL
jgi:predicted RND superfamily exporter protein